MLYSTTYQSPLGVITLVCDEEHLLEAALETQECRSGETAEKLHQDEAKTTSDILRKTICWLDLYFDGKNPDPHSLPLGPRGSTFRLLVWQELLKIPYGGTVTYGDIARTVAAKLHKEKMSAQAVGGAVGHNPIAIIVPCHRVVGSDGSLTGYAGGLDVKRRLLCHEGVDTDRLFRPERKNAGRRSPKRS